MIRNAMPTEKHIEYKCGELPAYWTPAHTKAAMKYLDKHHNTESDDPAFGFIMERFFYCESLLAMMDAAEHACATVSIEGDPDHG